MSSRKCRLLQGHPRSERVWRLLLTLTPVGVILVEVRAIVMRGRARRRGRLEGAEGVGLSTRRWHLGELVELLRASTNRATHAEPPGLYLTCFSSLNQAHVLITSPALAALVASGSPADDPNPTQCSRPQTVKRIWNHIKQNDLQDPNDKRHIVCDDLMYAVFKTKRLHMFT